MCLPIASVSYPRLIILIDDNTGYKHTMRENICEDTLLIKVREQLL